MKIRSLLTISHSSVIAIFALVFLSIFFYLTKPPSHPGRPGNNRMLSELVRKGKTPELLKQALREAGFQPDSTVDIFSADGHHERRLGGTQSLAPPADLEELLAGKEVQEFDPRDRSMVQWAAVNLDGERSHVLRISGKRGPRDFFTETRRNAVIACLAAFGAVFGIALLLSRALAEPLRHLASMVERFGQDTLSVRADSSKGPLEIRDLSQSFNTMAANIETKTVELIEQKEKAEHIEELRRQFLSDVSHNLRTPLMAILGWNDALIEGVADDEVRYRKRIRREVLYITKTVERLLELSRWEQAEPLMSFESVRLSDLLMEVAESLQDSAQEQGVSLSFEGLDPEMTVRVDRQKARDILQILLENVVAHAGSEVEATVKIQALGDRTEVVIEDTGQGFPLTFCSTSDLKRGASKVGRACLGLTIASRLVEAHGDSLQLENSEGGGARARFTFQSDLRLNKEPED